jgi:hypothetical protein
MQLLEFLQELWTLPFFPSSPSDCGGKKAFFCQHS